MSIRNLIAKRPWILAVGAAALVVGWLASGLIGDRQVREARPGTESVGNVESVARVQISSRIAEPVTRMISVYGQTEPARTVEMAAETEGRVETVEAERGRAQPLDRGAELMADKAPFPKESGAIACALEISWKELKLV